MTTENQTQLQCGARPGCEGATDSPPALGGELECWSCKTAFTLSEHADCDGCCPNCGSEIDLSEHVARLQAELDKALRLGKYAAACGIESEARWNAERDKLQAEVERLNADLVTFKGGISALGEAVKKLVICARTTGGTAGTDQGLMDACSGVENALSLSGVSRAIDYIEDLKAKYEAARDRKNSIVALKARTDELEGLLRIYSVRGLSPVLTEAELEQIDAALNKTEGQQS